MENKLLSKTHKIHFIPYTAKEGKDIFNPNVEIWWEDDVSKDEINKTIKIYESAIRHGYHMVSELKDELYLNNYVLDNRIFRRIKIGKCIIRSSDLKQEYVVQYIKLLRTEIQKHLDTISSARNNIKRLIFLLKKK